MSADDPRHSHASAAELISDPIELAKREALNGLRQIRGVEEMVEYYLDPERPFRLRPSQILHLHRYALDGISGYAGNWRPAAIAIAGSVHRPVDAHQVPEMIEGLCDYVNDHWSNSSPVHLAAYVMWKLNWIHPFTDGNGRTSRAASYMVLCLKAGYLLPGRRTIPEQIAEDRKPYYKALEAADLGWQNSKLDLSQMEDLISTLLARQLLELFEDATGRMFLKDDNS